MGAFSGLQPALQPWANALFNVAESHGLSPRVTSTFRSVAEQAILFDRFLAGTSRFPAAPPGRSLHNFGHAFDLIVNSPDAQDWIGQVWEAWGGRWGGRFNDEVHFDTGVTIP